MLKLSAVDSILRSRPMNIALRHLPQWRPSFGGTRPTSCFDYLVFVLVFSIILVPLGWYGNEINYFDLANRWVNSDLYSEYHAIRDGSVGRWVAYMLIGSGIRVFGMEGAFTFFNLALLAVFPMAYLSLVRALRVDLLSAALALIIFIFMGQSLVGGEFLFGTIEPKSFAYICVLFGLAGAFTGRRLTASLLMALAVYFHFLVGAFWGGAALLFYVVKDRKATAITRPLIIFAGLSMPLFAAILWERFGGSGLDQVDLELSINAIYAEYRAPHHIAPFLTLTGFLNQWLAGILTHFGLALVIWLWPARSDQLDRSFSVWLGGLNFYIVIATSIAFLDRDSHIFSWFYMFRPSALILLLSLLWAKKKAAQALRQRFSPIVFTVALIALLAALSPMIARALSQIPSGHMPLAAMLSPSQNDMVKWIKGHTSEDAIVVIEPLVDQPFMGEGGGVWAGMERLLARPTLVNYKFVPTAKADLVRWYDLILWRQSLFDGNCAAVYDYPVAYLVTRTGESIARLENCTTVAWRGDENAVLRVLPRH